MQVAKTRAEALDPGFRTQGRIESAEFLELFRKHRLLTRAVFVNDLVFVIVLEMS